MSVEAERTICAVQVAGTSDRARARQEHVVNLVQRQPSRQNNTSVNRVTFLPFKRYLKPKHDLFRTLSTCFYVLSQPKTETKNLNLDIQYVL